MCTVSMVIDNYYRDKFPQPSPLTQIPATQQLFDSVSREEFDKLKKEFEELKDLLKAAKKYDEATGQPDCEIDSKVDFIKKMADMLGVDVNDVFEPSRVLT